MGVTNERWKQLYSDVQQQNDELQHQVRQWDELRHWFMELPAFPEDVELNIKILEASPAAIVKAVMDKNERLTNTVATQHLYAAAYGEEAMRGSIIASLRGYPDVGGDVEVMAEVRRIVREAIKGTYDN